MQLESIHYYPSIDPNIVLGPYSTMSNVNQANDRKAALIGQLMTLLIIFCSSKVFSKAFFSQLSPSGTRVSLISVASYWAGLLKNRSKIAKRNQLVCISKYLNKLSKITPPTCLYIRLQHLVIIQIIISQCVKIIKSCLISISKRAHGV